MYDSLRVLVVSNMVPSTEVPQYGVFVMRQTAALEQAGAPLKWSVLSSARRDYRARYASTQGFEAKARMRQIVCRPTSCSGTISCQQR